MAKPIREFLRREEGVSFDEGGQWRFTGDTTAEQMKATGDQVPNNPDNLRSFSGGEGQYTRRNPYGDAEQLATQVSPVLTKPDQWGAIRKLPNVDPAAEMQQQGPGWGFGTKSPANTVPMGDTSSYAAMTLGVEQKPAPKARRGTSFGLGAKRNAPPPDKKTA